MDIKFSYLNCWAWAFTAIVFCMILMSFTPLLTWGPVFQQILCLSSHVYFT